jgi:hypothetical protein
MTQNSGRGSTVLLFEGLDTAELDDFDPASPIIRDSQ